MPVFTTCAVAKDNAVRLPSQWLATPARYLLAGLLALAACKAPQVASGISGRPDAPLAPAPFDPAAAKAQLVLPPTKIIIFGLGHLDRASPKFQTAWLEPVLCRLRVYKPDVILTEAMSGEQIMSLDAYAAYHGDAIKYAGSSLEMAKTTQAELKLTAPQALVQANALCQKGNLTAAERRQLAGLFVAAAEPFSATVQWLRLAPAERIGADGVSPSLAKRLDRYAALRNELVSLAARLAADLGLERTYGAGDHASDVALPSDAAMNAALAAEPSQIDLFNHKTPAFRAVPEDTM